ncbi:hypothetical protein LMH87_004864 [Akanthomyces muscarius]|uniref:Zn(2)-C6 fungal-type domain-containing protein n=1 Tax=Akanthomyces muscarius TaxID=2231603 RepID=A0A9W8Q676_AKAMU|nr:hypothetical protein LMH87_004864 [Akanthomyces muscarius]KAJ4146034.1 hypothetical protein LMH87_004864 [Akanthomyces muscarius]
MSAPVSKRRRVRKACTPCHQRKRKCDNRLPCGMCTAYEYDCFYGDSLPAGEANGQHRQQHSSARRASPQPTAARRAAAADPPKSPRTARDGRETDETTTPRSRRGRGSTPDGIFDEYKSRYAGASAAMAFPHVLGVALGSSSPPPRMRSFAYNFGIRPEETSHTHGSLSRLISADDLTRFSSVFFSAMAPIADLMDQNVYSTRCRDYFHDAGPNIVAFGAVAAGVAALGSFLSASRHPQETELVRYAKAILDDPVAMRALTVDHIVASGLRVFYLRATTRPNNAWIASCTVLHLCEAVGLHREEIIVKTAAMPGARAMGHSEDQLRRVFWIAYAGHKIMSYEYDRSSVSFNAVTCGEISRKAGSVADQFVTLGQILPGPNSPFRLEREALTPTEELCERLRALDKLHFEHPFMVVTKADLTFCFYRRMYQLKMGIPDKIIHMVINSGNAAIVAAEQLASQGRMFWNVIGSVFQYTCVLLAMDTPAANAHISKAFESLGNLVRAADTGLTREALSMARRLLSLSTAKKRRELEMLEAVEASYQDSPPQPEPPAGSSGEMTWDMDWDQFLVEPYLTMFGLDATL